MNQRNKNTENNKTNTTIEKAAGPQRGGPVGRGALLGSISMIITITIMTNT